MTDQSNIPRITQLLEQWTSYKQAVDVLTLGGGIKMFLLRTPDGVQPIRGAAVNAAGIITPPQMLDNIKQQIEQRLATIIQELTDLGVSGVDQPPQIAATSAFAPTPTPTATTATKAINAADCT